MPPLNKNGLPVTNSFPASNSNVIKRYFQSCTTVGLVYTVMVQSLEKHAQSFCLTLFGIDNKFKVIDVLRRWNYFMEQAKQHNIEIAGVSSDGDTRLLQAIRHHMKLGTQSISTK